MDILFRRFTPLYLWGAGLLLWLGGWLLPLPAPVSLLLLALAGVMSALPLIPAEGSVKALVSGESLLLPVCWLTGAFWSGQAVAGTLAILLYSVGAFVFARLLQKRGLSARDILPAGVSYIGDRAVSAARRITGGIAVVAAVCALLLPWWTDLSVYDGWARALPLLLLTPAGIWPLTVALQLRAGRLAAAKEGAEIRGVGTVERLADTDSVSLDKQGTLIREPLVVTGLNTLPEIPADMCAGMAALLEQGIDHPIARALVAHAERLRVEPHGQIGLTDVTYESSMGVTARLGERRLICGNHHLLDKHGLVAEDLPESTVYLAIDNRVVASFEISGPLREDAATSLFALRQQGADTFVLMTGDHPTAAEKAAVQVGIDKVYAGLYAESKAALMRDLQRRYRTAVYIGSGQEDIAAMKQADIAVTFADAPVAVQEAARVRLHGGLTSLPRGMAVCQQTMRRIRQKGRIGGVVGVAAVAAGLLGVLPLWGAALIKSALVLSSLVGVDKQA